ncbi:MAG: IspD/TarI family cytidylyltransferase [Bacillota bacterium]|jgi:2-C-methyl-D-erythritol 4-phosphate cytidylyltransferase
MIIASILAGGTGQRLGSPVPKQFMDVLGKPLIVHALEVYERSSHIDAIQVVSVPEYIPTVWEYAEKWGINKLRWVVPGGASCQESTRNGIFSLEGICSDSDVLMFGMSTSVFVDDDIIADSLRVCKEHGNAFAAMQCIYNLARTSDGLTANHIEYKEIHKTLNMPWTAPFGTFYRLYRRAYAENIQTSPTSYAPTLFLALGETLYLSKDTPRNKLHVTTQEDLEIIEACLRFQKEKGEERA